MLAWEWLENEWRTAINLLLKFFSKYKSKGYHWCNLRILGGGEAIQGYCIRKSMFPLIVFADCINFLGQKNDGAFFVLYQNITQKYGEIQLNNNSKIIIIINNTLKGTQINGNYYPLLKVMAFKVALEVKNLPANAGNVRYAGSIPGSGRSPGEGNGNPLQYSCLAGYSP